VILLFYDTFPRPDNLFIDEGADGVLLLRITSDWAKANEHLGNIYEKRKQFRQVDELNKLYVALTRAEKEMYLLSVKAKKASSPSEFFPPHGYRDGIPEQRRAEPPQPERFASIVHPAARGIQQSPGVGTITTEEAKRGEFIHAVLSRIEYLAADAEKQIDEAIPFFAADIRKSFDLPSIKNNILALLRNEHLAQFFAPHPDRRVRNEQEITAADGGLHRVDRLLIDPRVVTVIDYKTGGESDEHHEQVLQYMNLARGLFPNKAVHGFLAYVDLNIVRKVK
jgi:ATP-dependent exoDNAse (exonuclease V) beta subunit